MKYKITFIEREGFELVQHRNKITVTITDDFIVFSTLIEGALYIVPNEMVKGIKLIEEYNKK